MVFAEPTLGRRNAPQVEKVSAQILQDCLISDGSLLTPGASIWNLDTATELQLFFAKTPDAPVSVSEARVQELPAASPAARQLYAEIDILYLLPHTLDRAAKIQEVEKLLDQLDTPVDLTSDVLDAFAEGVLYKGQGLHRQRWQYLSFLVEFVTHVKQQDTDVRCRSASDHHALSSLVRDAPGPKAQVQRHALLYLFQPRHFPPIVSDDHRSRLRNRLSEYLFRDDVDAGIREIILSIEAQAGGPVDLYDATWRPRWLDEPLSDGEDSDPVESSRYSIDDIVGDGCFHDRNRLQDILTRWQEKKNLVLQGAPGTGKTWLAKRLAQALIGSPSTEAIRIVQFHPNTSYEDFVRGWRPDADGRLKLIDGALIEHAGLAEKSAGVPHVLIIEEINRGNPAQAFGEMLTLIEASKRSARDALTLSYRHFDDEQFHLPENLYIIGTMNVADRSLALVDFALRRRFAFETLEPALTDAWATHTAEKLGNDAVATNEIRLRIETLNRTIADDPMLGPHFAVGHSFVTPVTRHDDARGWFDGVVQTQIAPLLAEYWFDNPDKAKAEVGKLRL